MQITTKIAGLFQNPKCTDQNKRIKPSRYYRNYSTSMSWFYDNLLFGLLARHGTAGGRVMLLIGFWMRWKSKISMKPFISKLCL
jgi:hypothetical protein